MSKQKLLVICGPTASGKTSLGVDCALRYGGEIVSADSMQLYRTMDIGTAKPTVAQQRGIPHHLIDCLDPGEECSVARWCGMAKEAIAAIAARNKLPIIVGGTGLYIRSLLQNISFSPMEPDLALRETLSMLTDEQLHQQLAAADPVAAARIAPADRKRAIRALEVLHTTGQTMTQQISRSREHDSPYDPLVLGIRFADRAVLYDSINRRVKQMVEQGLLLEVRALMKINPGATALQAIGYKEFSAFLRGECLLSEAIALLQQQTRRYAKRQLTWFAKEEGIGWLTRTEQTDEQELLTLAVQQIDSWFELDAESRKEANR